MAPVSNQWICPSCGDKSQKTAQVLTPPKCDYCGKAMEKVKVKV